MATNIYVLKLRTGKWYVGKTHNVLKRFQEHLSGYGCSWTKKYRPISIETTIENTSPFDEDKITKEYMVKYGIDNVRGGSYCNPRLNDLQMEVLKMEIWHAQNRCARCGRSGHFQKDCYAKTDVNGDEFISDEEDIVCFRCGREGHISPECYARTHINGYYIR